MRLLSSKLLPALLLMTATPALAFGPYDDARDCIVSGDYGAAMLVIDTGAMAVNMQDEEGYTLLHHAARQGSEAAVKALLDRGADRAIKDKNGKVAADLATLPAIKDLLLKPTS